MSINNGTSIEDALLDFVENNSPSFELTRPLTPIDRAQIKERFWQNYSEVKKAPHFDEFTLLDDSKPGPFVSHQGSICCSLAEFIHVVQPEIAPEYFEHFCVDFRTRKSAITPTNPCVHAAIELNIEELLEKITDEDQLQAVLKKLPKDLQRDILASPKFKRLQLPKLLLHVARGEQDKANILLEVNAEVQLLLQNGTFTDYSGRTFHCTAYEYAYWAKDIRMCRMLEQHMDAETKAEMLKRCEAMECDGLDYIQDREEKNSKYFDFTPLITALQEYVNGYRAWAAEKNWDAAGVAWMKVGKAQRDVPAHVAHEYCRRYRTFESLSEFNQPTLLRLLTFNNWEALRNENWFPLAASTSSGLGVDFALDRASATHAHAWSGRGPEVWRASVDLVAVSKLDEVRTADLTQSRANLTLAASASRLGQS